MFLYFSRKLDIFLKSDAIKQQISYVWIIEETTSSILFGSV